MILTGPEIAAQHELGSIVIDPFDERQLNPNSYDFRLGSLIRTYSEVELDAKIDNPSTVSTIPESGLVLLPDRIYLGHTEEVMGSTEYVPIIRAKSSVARLGLFIHVTADLIDIGSINQWTLQLHAVQPMIVYAGMRIGQVTFWRTEGEVELYAGKYQGTRGPVPSRSYRDFGGN